MKKTRRVGRHRIPAKETLVPLQDFLLRKGLTADIYLSLAEGRFGMRPPEYLKNGHAYVLRDYTRRWVKRALSK